MIDDPGVIPTTESIKEPSTTTSYTRRAVLTGGAALAGGQPGEGPGLPAAPT